jgi:Spy/CpxP family protein refolding chaperone
MAGRSLALVALSITLSAAAARAADPPAPSGEQRLICRGGERRLGSHTRTPQRCRTAEQWHAEDEANGRIPISLQVTQGQNDGRVTPTPQ